MPSVTCSFVMDRDIYNQYKSILSSEGKSVKGNLVQYMKSVIETGITNPETIEALQEVEEFKKGKKGKSYNSFDELLEELDV